MYSGIKWQRIKSDEGKPEDMQWMWGNGAKDNIVYPTANNASKQDFENILKSKLFSTR